MRVFQKDADVPVWDITVQYRTAAALLQKKILNPKGNTQHKAPYSSKAADPRTAGPTAAGKRLFHGANQLRSCLCH